MIKPIIESLDDAPETYRPAYVEENGKFILDVGKYDAIATKGIRENNQRLKAEKEALRAEASKYDRFKELLDDDDFDVETYRQLKAGAAKPTDKAGDNDAVAQARELIRKEREKWQREEREKLAAKDAELKDTTTKYGNRVKRLALTNMAVEAGVLPDVLEDVVELHMGRFGVSDLEKGKLFLIEDGEESLVTPEHYFNTVYKALKPRFYGASDKGGSGASPNGGQGGSKAGKVMRRAEFDKLPAAAQMKYMREVGQLQE